MPAVFISYSRRDTDFVKRLHDALTARNYDVWVDWEDIPPSAKWFDEIRAGVGSADGFIYVISPDSVASEICTRELEHAAEQHKRIVPVVHREPDQAKVPEAAATLNWVFLRDHDEFAAGIELLIAALETDLEHVRTHTRLGVAAGRWDASGHDGSQLLRGAELASAERWLVSVGDKQPQPTQLQREYVLASRQAATRRQRTFIAAVSLALLVAVVLGVVALIQRATAVRESNVAFARQLDANAQTNYSTDPELSVLLAVKAAQVDPGTITERALRQALAVSHLRSRITIGQAVAGDALWSPDGSRLLVTSPGAWARIYRPGTTLPPVSVQVPQGSPGSRNESGWDGAGRRVVIGGANPAVYDAATGRLLTRLPGTAGKAVLSRDGMRVVTVDHSTIGHVFDAATGRELASFRPAHRGGATCLALSPDGSVVAQCDAALLSGSEVPGALDTWDSRTGRLLHSVPTPHLIGTVSFSPDGSLYAFATTPSRPTGARASTSALARALGLAGTFVYGSRSGSLVKAFPGPASVAAFSPNADAGVTLAYATIGDQLGHVYNFKSGVELLLTGHTGVIQSLAFNGAGTDVMSAGNDGTSRVYDSSTGALLEQLAGDTEPIWTASFGLGDKAIVTSSEDGSVRVWASPDPRPELTLPGDRHVPATISFSADSRRIIEAAISGQGRILDVRDLHQLAAFNAPVGGWFAGATESRDGRLVAALMGSIRRSGTFVGPNDAVTFDARSGRPLARITPDIPGAVPITAALDNAGDRLVTVGSNGAAEEWDPRTGKRLESLPGTGIPGAVAYSKDGSILAIAHLPALPAKVGLLTQFGNVRIDLWDAGTGKLLRAIKGDQLQSQLIGTRQFAPLALAFRPDGKVIALSGADTAIQLYATRTGVQKGNLPLNQHFAASLAFSPDGTFLAAGTAASVFLCRLIVGAGFPACPELQHADSSTYGEIKPGTGVYVGFTADSRRLLTVGDLALEVWDVSDHQQLFKAFAFRGNLSPDGTTLVSASGGGVSLYRCELCGSLQDLLALARRHTTRGFTPDERATYLSRG